MREMWNGRSEKNLTHDYNADNAGNYPEEGDFVAYNYSGQIATGWIRHVSRSKSGRSLGKYIINQLHPHEDHVSRVRGGPKCVLVLQKADGSNP